MALIILRCVFMIVAVGLTTLFVRSDALPTGPILIPWVIFFGVLGVALSVILFDVYMPRKRIDTISAVYFGVVVGMVLTYACLLRYHRSWTTSTATLATRFELVWG